VRITAKEKMENCFQHDFVFRYIFDAKWTKKTIQSMGTFGKLRYYESFPIPMFHVTFLDSTIIKGLQGEDECRVTFPRIGTAEAKNRFETTFNAYGGWDGGKNDEYL
jgi:hypothetical protein